MIGARISVCDKVLKDVYALPRYHAFHRLRRQLGHLRPLSDLRAARGVDRRALIVRAIPRDTGALPGLARYCLRIAQRGTRGQLHHRVPHRDDARPLGARVGLRFPLLHAECRAGARIPGTSSVRHTAQQAIPHT
eukprot:2630841-Prymnesium_polylepis.1